MENFEKKIIEFCKEKDGCKFFTGIGIVLTIIAIIVLAIEFIFKIWMPIIYLLVLILMFGCSIFEKVARKIEQTNEEVFFRNKLFYVILSDKSVCDQIFFCIKGKIVIKNSDFFITICAFKRRKKGIEFI